jgi:MarR family transcriptional regulator for hemolysin
MSAPAKTPEAQGECPECLAGNLAWLLAQAHFALTSEVRAAFAPLGVSARGYHVLAAALRGEHTQTELVEILGLDKTTMVVTIDELERDGLAERQPSETDRRARVITVTQAGERMVDEGRALIDRVQADVLATLPKRERDVLLDALATLVRGRLSEQVECTPALRRR